jgi:hypothetical protein
MSEQGEAKETFARMRHGLKRFMGKSMLTYEQKKEFDAEIDPLGGILDRPNWEKTKAEMELEANRPAVYRAARRLGRWVVERWKDGQEPNIRTYDTNLIIDEGDWLISLAETDPAKLTPRQRQEINVAEVQREAAIRQEEIERGAAVFEGFQPDPDPNGFYDEFRSGKSSS